MPEGCKLSQLVFQNDLVVRGDVETDGVLVVKGRVNGNINGAGVGVGRSGQVVGDVVGQVVVIEGSLSGNIDGQNVFIGTHGVVKGTIHYATLSVEHGGQFDVAGFMKKPG